jgi:hypothetical protein
LNSKASFFQPKFTGDKDHKFRVLFLNFFVKNNLSFSIVDQASFRELVNYLGNVPIPSRRALCTDLESMFKKTQETVKERLQTHVRKGGRISLTTDTWSAKNRKEFMAITAHYMNNTTFINQALILDVLELLEPVHSGVYMCQELIKVTDFFEITMAIFTVSHDNAKPNTTLVREFQAAVEERYQELSDEDQARFSLQFKVSSGSIRCFAHTINLAVQEGQF